MSERERLKLEYGLDDKELDSLANVVRDYQILGFPVELEKFLLAVSELRKNTPSRINDRP